MTTAQKLATLRRLCPALADLKFQTPEAAREFLRTEKLSALYADRPRARQALFLSECLEDRALCRALAKGE